MNEPCVDIHIWWLNVMSLEGPRPITRLVLSAAYISFADLDEDGKPRPVSLERLVVASHLNRGTVVQHLKLAMESGWLVEVNPPQSKNRNLRPSLPHRIGQITGEGERKRANTTNQPEDHTGPLIRLH